jgi:hypothetical protein
MSRSSVIGKEEGIQHGTVKGYRAHTYRQVEMCEPCRQALREKNRAKTQDSRPAKPSVKRPRFKSEDQAAWYGGQFPADGTARIPTPITIPGSCATEGCGQAVDAADESGPIGWVRARVHGSTEPERTWCSGSCAAYGIALAELRMS